MEDRKETGEDKEKSPASGASQARYESVLMQEAHAAREKGDYQGAARLFEDILKRFRSTLPEDQVCVVHTELGTLWYWLGDYDAAKNACENALRCGNNDQANNILGKIAVAEYLFPKARGYFSHISSDNPARDLGLCLVSLKLRDMRGAQIFFDEARGKTPPNDPELRVMNAYLLLLKGEMQQSVIQARELVKKSEKDPPMMLLLAEILMTAGHYGEAKSISQKVRKACPENDVAFGIEAYAEYSEEQWEASKQSAERAVQANPLNAYAKTVLMKLACRNGNYSSAESLGLQILEDSPEYSLAHANLGDVYFNEGRYELAQVEYEQTQQLMNSETKGARLRQARMKFIHSDFDGAAEILEKLIEGYHTYYDDAMCDLALCYDELNDEERKEGVMDKMSFRKSFYHRTEKILESLRNQ